MSGARQEQPIGWTYYLYAFDKQGNPPSLEQIEAMDKFIEREGSSGRLHQIHYTAGLKSIEYGYARRMLVVQRKVRGELKWVVITRLWHFSLRFIQRQRSIVKQLI